MSHKPLELTPKEGDVLTHNNRTYTLKEVWDDSDTTYGENKDGVVLDSLSNFRKAVANGCGSLTLRTRKR